MTLSECIPALMKGLLTKDIMVPLLSAIIGGLMALSGVLISSRLSKQDSRNFIKLQKLEQLFFHSKEIADLLVANESYNKLAGSLKSREKSQENLEKAKLAAQEAISKTGDISTLLFLYFPNIPQENSDLAQPLKAAIDSHKVFRQQNSLLMTHTEEYHLFISAQEKLLRLLHEHLDSLI